MENKLKWTPFCNGLKDVGNYKCFYDLHIDKCITNFIKIWVVQKFFDLIVISYKHGNLLKNST